ncbi:MAG: hypothetical protein IIA45_03795 [Bacteroidetes bacterium]|nr:hypothetical protein [Bacteroidota bacterium]
MNLWAKLWKVIKALLKLCLILLWAGMKAVNVISEAFVKGIEPFINNKHHK